MASRIGNTGFAGQVYKTAAGYGNVVASEVPVYSNGWITDVKVLAGGDGTTCRAKLAVWDQDGTLLWSAPQDTWNAGIESRSATIPDGIKVYAGTSVFIGFWRRKEDPCQFATSHGAGLVRVGTHTTTDDVPAAFTSFDRFEPDTLAANAAFVANQAPLASVWRSPSGGGVSSVVPVWQGEMSHGMEEMPYDRVEEVQLTVWVSTTGTVIFNASFGVTDADRDAGFWTRSDIQLSAGGAYIALYRLKDSFGVWSPWSVMISLVTAAGPAAPTPLEPAANSRITADRPTQFRGTYSHPSGTPFGGQVALEIWAATWSPARGKWLPQYRIAQNITSGTVLNASNEWTVPGSWIPYPLRPGMYMWRAETKDNQGRWGVSTSYILFRVNEAPNAPFNLSPGGGKATSNRQISASVSDPSGDPIVSAVAELVRASDGAYVYNALPWVSKQDYLVNDRVRPSVPNGHAYVASIPGRAVAPEPVWPTGAGATVRDNAGLVAIARSTAYTVGLARLRPGGALTDPDWWECTTAGTTAATAPAYPASGTAGQTITDGTAVFTCRKTITWTEAGSDTAFTMTVASDGQTISTSIPANLITLGTRYNWRARASDDGWPSPGAWSAWSEWIYADAPTVNLISPRPGVVRNLVKQPNAENDPAVVGSFWTDTGLTGGSTISRVNDGDAFEGLWAWRGAFASGGGNPVRRSDFMPVDPTKPYFFSARFKREAGQPLCARHFYVEAYNAAGTLLSTMYPGDMPQGTDPGTLWVERKGYIGPAGFTLQWPAATTQIRLVWEPSRNIVSASRLDNVFVKELSAGLTQATADATIDWHGYFDGSHQSNVPAGTYAWEGVQGNSTSVGLNVLRASSEDLIIAYAGATAKSADRLVIEQWDGSSWQALYDSGFVASARTQLPFPQNQVKNGGYYRLRVEAKDSGAIVLTGATDWLYFEVAYEGPAELQITRAEGLPDTAQIILEWKQSTLPSLEFVGYEVAIQEAGSTTRKIVALLTNQQNPTYTYHWPVTSKPYVFRVRQIQNVGAEQIAGRWTVVNARVEYRKWYLKDLEDPDGYTLAFDVMADDTPTRTPKAPITAVTPWGSKVPTHFVGEERSSSGTVTVRIQWNDPTADAKQAVLEALEDRRLGVCLLSYQPNRKKFAMLTSIQESDPHLPWSQIWALTWEETQYEEDYYAREGVTPSAN